MNRILTSLFLSVVLFACSPGSKQQGNSDKNALTSHIGEPDSTTGLTPDVEGQEGLRMAGMNDTGGDSASAKGQIDGENSTTGATDSENGHAGDSENGHAGDSENGHAGDSENGKAGDTENDHSNKAGSGSGPMSIKALLGRIDPASDANFVRIEAKYTTKSGIYMRKEAYEAFKEMHAAAQADGINLTIVSATRTFGAQKGIWERKWSGVTKVGGKNLATSTPDPVARAKAILTYSSMPGTSRHHWGTDIDLNNLNNEWFESGTGQKIYNWLTLNAGDYGFCQTYTVIGEERPHGYLEERWHWSYTPLSSQFLKDYEAQIKHSDINGFQGSEVAGDINVIAHYVSGVNPECKH